ncbi:C40 family peptidase [Herbaspirillum sp. RV1423]|uniref:C40 family peptidase n=1 Tax=Herbaspirillum sp. RV1423 TaxID=1443993 RepID=UPI0004BB49BB|nr:C40 family peptidase [Herbaspirillum sp. RV1423]
MRSLHTANTSRAPDALNALAACCIAVLLTACGVAPTRGPDMSTAPATDVRSETATEQGSEVAIYALDMIGTGYRFGGKNPEAGFDCSGMVSYIFSRAAGLKLRGSAADMARQGRPVDKANLRPGDLVFFNTLNRPFSHVGIYIGDGRFVHAPSGNGKVHISRMDNPYFAPRFEMARAYFN